jgi:site-specific DNA-methyltransferase (adenine-specific)
MKIEHVKLSAIKSNPNNPRLIKDDKFKKLVQSIKDFPKMLELRPIVVNDDMVVLGGNMRLKACKEVGLKEVPIIKASELTEDQQREFIVKDNVGFGEWDWDMIANEWDTEQLVEWGLDLPKDMEVRLDAEEDDFEVPEGGIETDIVIGDLFEIGEHRLLCGDSTQTDTFEKLFGGHLADLVVTDPPYNVAYEGKTKDALTIKNDSMSNDAFYQFLYDFYTALGAYTKAGGAWYVWHADSEGANFRLAMKNAGIMVKQCLIWVKQTMVMGRQDYQWKHEPCLYGWKEGAAHGWYSDRKQTTVLNFDRPSRNAEHPTMKPIPLFSYQIGNSSKEGDIVADAFGGSGTTMVACHQMQRKAYLVEFDPKYCQVIIDRMKKLDPSLVIKRNGTIYESTESNN